MCAYMKHRYMCMHASCIKHLCKKLYVSVSAYTNEYEVEMLANPLTYEHSDVMRKWVDVRGSRPVHECVVCF